MTTAFKVESAGQYTTENDWYRQCTAENDWYRQYTTENDWYRQYTTEMIDIHIIDDMEMYRFVVLSIWQHTVILKEKLSKLKQDLYQFRSLILETNPLLG